MTADVLVLGSTGKTGRRLVHTLTQQGVAVRAASRTPNAGQVRFDWSDETSYAPALEGTSAVYLVPPDLVENPSPMTGQFLEWARAAGVEKLVLLSSLGATFPEEPAHSGRRVLDQQVRDSGMAWTILRPSGFAQNFTEGFLLPGILNGNAVVSATGNGAAPMVDADDIAHVAAASITTDRFAGQELSITGPAALTFDEAVSVIGEVSGRVVLHRHLTPDAFRSILGEFGVPADYAEMLVRDQVAIREGAASDVSDTVERVTGWPAVSFWAFAEAASAVWAVPAVVA